MPQPPDAEGWLTLAEAAERLGTTPKYVANRIREGRLAGVKHNNRLWVSAAAVVERLAERETWVSNDRAAEILGCSAVTVERLVHDGVLTTRSLRGRPSLRRAEVLQVAEARRAAREERLAVMREREAAYRPPDDVHEWIGAGEAAALLGVSASQVRVYAAAERVPCVKKDGRWWFRRDLVELQAAARIVARTRRIAPATQDG